MNVRKLLLQVSHNKDLMSKMYSMVGSETNPVAHTASSDASSHVTDFTINGHS